MAKKIIKHRLFTWFEETDNPFQPGGPSVLTERIAHLGEEVDITNPVYVQRGEDLGSFYSDEEAAQIKDGTYRGASAEAVFRARAGIAATNQIEPADDEGFQTDALTVDELADYIRENKLNVDQTVSLAGDTIESVEKVLDAENIATDNEPRKGVTERLEVKLAAVAGS